MRELYRESCSAGRSVMQGIHATTKRELIGSDDARVDGEQAASDPPSHGVSEEVDLLARVVVGPEADASEQERPLVGKRRVRAAAGQLVVVPEHGPLQLEPLLQEGYVSDLLLGLGAARVIGREGGDVLDEPDVGARRDQLVAVDL